MVTCKAKSKGLISERTEIPVMDFNKKTHFSSL